MNRLTLKLGALAVALLSASATAEPTLPCAGSGGPDPVRFRPGLAVPGATVAAAGSARLTLAADADAATGAEWVAPVWIDEAGALQVATSFDGACSFAAAIELSAGPVDERPAAALRADDTGWWLAVGWREAGRALVRGTDRPDMFPDVAELDGTALAGPVVALAPAPATVVLAAAWVAADGTLRVATTPTPADPASWSAPLDVASGLAASVELALAADAEGMASLAGLTLAWTDGATVMVARSADGGASFAPARRVDDGAFAPTGGLDADAGPDAAAGARVLLGWSATGGGDDPVLADAARHEGGALAFDFDGVAGAATPIMEARAEPLGRSAVAVTRPGPAAVAWERAGEIEVALRSLQDNRPVLFDGCGPARVSGLDPDRGGAGSASEPVAAALGTDVVLAWIDDCDGTPAAWLKRSDASPPDPGTVDVAATGCGEPPALQLSWPAPACDVVEQVVEVGLSPGATDIARTVDPSASDFLVEGLDPATTYHVRLRVRDSAGHEAVSAEVTGETAACSDIWLEASVSTFADACPFGGAGGDGVLDPGETATVQVSVRNRGTAMAPGARVRLRSRSPDVHVVSGWVDLGDVDADATVLADVDVDLSATLACGGAAEVLAESDSDGARWGDLLDIGPPLGCTPCVGACVVTAQADGPAETCRGTEITLDGSASASLECAGRLLHEWWEGGQLVGTGASVDRSPNDTVTYRLVVRCSTDLACTHEDTLDVTVHPRPSIGFAEDPPPPHCEGDVVVLRASTGDPAATFLWDDGTTDDFVMATEGGVRDVTVTDSNGCTRTRSWRLDFALQPLADAGPPPSGCAPQPIGTPAVPLLDYSWEPPDGLDDASSAQPLASPAMPTTYTVTVTDPLSGCTATDTVDVDVDPPAARVSGLRVARSGTDLLFSWDIPAGMPAVRVYGELDVTRSRLASGRSATARLACEDPAACAAAAPAPVEFFQAVSLCSDGLTEGPN